MSADVIQFPIKRNAPNQSHDFDIGDIDVVSFSDFASQRMFAKFLDYKYRSFAPTVNHKILPLDIGDIVMVFEPVRPETKLSILQFVFADEKEHNPDDTYDVVRLGQDYIWQRGGVHPGDLLTPGDIEHGRELSEIEVRWLGSQVDLARPTNPPLYNPPEKSA
jgi:hypothetical protein